MSEFNVQRKGRFVEITLQVQDDFNENLGNWETSPVEFDPKYDTKLPFVSTTSIQGAQGSVKKSSGESGWTQKYLFCYCVQVRYPYLTQKNP